MNKHDYKIGDFVTLLTEVVAIGSISEGHFRNINLPYKIIELTPRYAILANEKGKDDGNGRIEFQYIQKVNSKILLNKKLTQLLKKLNIK